uniref:Inversin n=1 Tax=Xiphophorus couchianus TaxID=32473 RepID=A0A3B5MXG1_9TELE
MQASATSSPRSASPGSQVHAAAVNGDRSALVKLITGQTHLRDHEDQFGRTPLMYCVLADRLHCADVLLKAGALVNKTDHSQRSALHLAAQKGNVRFLKLLLSRRANCLQKDLEGMTPLHLATRHPSPKALALLLKHIGPGEVDTQDKNKQTALHWSAFYNRREHVRLLIKHDSNIGIPDSEGKIPLHWAAHSQEASATQTVRCILEAAPTESLLNWQDYEGRTPLHFAVADGNEAVVEVLTSYEGCNVTAYDNLFRTPLHWAALLGHAKIVHLLLERNTSGTIPSDSQGATPLHYGAQSNNAETVGVFLSHPSVKDEPDLEGRTAFMWAAGKGSDEVIRTMLTLVPRIDINMADKYGGTALHAASLSGQVSTVKLLLEKGATVDSLDVMKHTPLFRACEMGYKDVILTLIKGSACVELVDVDGHTALHWAALGGNAEVCQILMENGISPNVQDHAGRTPLQCAAYGGYITCMAVLMENNADPNIQDKEGRTALHWSCNNGYLDAVKLLLGYNAFPNQMEHTEERYTPLDYALLGGHSEVTQFMLEHGALSIAAIQDIAAATIQAVYKGYTVRKAFRERKQLLMRHEQLRKDAAK